MPIDKFGRHLWQHHHGRANKIYFVKDKDGVGNLLRYCETELLKKHLKRDHYDLDGKQFTNVADPDDSSSVVTLKYLNDRLKQDTLKKYIDARLGQLRNELLLKRRDNKIDLDNMQFTNVGEPTTDDNLITLKYYKNHRYDLSAIRAWIEDVAKKYMDAYNIGLKEQLGNLRFRAIYQFNGVKGYSDTYYIINNNDHDLVFYFDCIVTLLQTTTGLEVLILAPPDIPQTVPIIELVGKTMLKGTAIRIKLIPNVSHVSGTLILESVVTQ